MGVTLAIFSLSWKTLCDKDRSKLCFSGVANSPKQHLIILVLISSSPGLLLNLWEEKASFSSIIELWKEYCMVVFFQLALDWFLQKILLNSFATSFSSRMLFPLTISFSEIVVYYFCFPIDLFYYFPSFLYNIFIFHDLFWIVIFFRFAFNWFK